MFTVKAAYSDEFELATTVEAAKEFFSDMKNFARLMPGVSEIHIDNNGIAHWRIEADVPMVGTIRQKFAVEKTEDSEDRIEWFPIKAETENLLRFSADFLQKAKDVTLVHFTQMVEIRRRSARDLHMLAGLVGETIISNEMTRKVSEMINVFIQRAKEKLEK